MVTVKEIYKGTNISDSWCESKIARFNDILSSFAIEVYDLYPQKRIERFAPAECKSQLETQYPIAKIWGFYWKWCCNIPCSEDPRDCCAGFKKLLLTEMYWGNIDNNSYSYHNLDNKWIVVMTLPTWLNDAFIVYSKWFKKVTSIDDNIDIDQYMLSALRQYMKYEYALEGQNDINMSANYYSKFQTKLNKLKEMYANQTKYIFPWALSVASK